MSTSECLADYKVLTYLSPMAATEASCCYDACQLRIVVHQGVSLIKMLS
jgi:hypothetical protein